MQVPTREELAAIAVDLMALLLPHTSAVYMLQTGDSKKAPASAWQVEMPASSSAAVVRASGDAKRVEPSFKCHRRWTAARNSRLRRAPAA
jgi:hypothetical protein